MITKFFKFVADLVTHSFAISLLCFVGFGPSSKATQRERVAPFAAMGSFLSAWCHFQVGASVYYEKA